jgi:hypothetical protein
MAMLIAFVVALWPSSVPAVEELLVLHDDGTLSPKFDLAGQLLRFTPNDTGGYDVLHLTGVSLASDVGESLDLTDDAAVAVPLGGVFRFYGRDYDVAYVSTNGQLTFDVPDPSGADDIPGVALLREPARIAGLLDDLTLGESGRVSVMKSPAILRTTWSDMIERRGGPPGGGSTWQVTLFLSTGVIEMAYGTVAARAGFVGISPGKREFAYLLDLSMVASVRAQGPLGIGESFRADLVEGLVAARVLSSTGDRFDFIVLLRDASYPRPDNGRARFHPVRNEIDGLGLSLFDRTASYGSAGRLQGVVHVFEPPGATSAVGSYPLLSHEFEHRWGFYVSMPGPMAAGRRPSMPTGRCSSTRAARI